MNQQTPISMLINQIKEQLKPLAGDDTLHEQTAWWLLEALTGSKKAQLIIQESSLSATQRATLTQWIHDLIHKHKPLAYILGSVPFEDLEILCEPPILIPRPETEEWAIELALQLEKVNTSLDILDLCTGSGCIALLLAKELPKSRVVAADISPKAIALAHKNALHNHIAGITFIQSDLFEHISPHFTFDSIVSNPPYIDPEIKKSLDASVKDWEDPHALFAQNSGLAIIARIIEKAPTYLKANEELKQQGIPQLVIEIGYDQGAAVTQLLNQAGYVNIQIKKDSEGKDRVAYARVS